MTAPPPEREAEPGQPRPEIRYPPVTSAYATFLARKNAAAPNLGRHITDREIHPTLHPWQREIITWAVRTGRAAIWADTGLGKTRMQLEWARLSTGPDDTALIVAPLAVCQQTAREATAIGIDASYVRHQDQITHPGIWITNYEMIDHFDPAQLTAVVLDEASILKSSDGKTRTKLIRHFADVPARLACTATPAPNDPEELTSQAEFLGRSTRANMLAAYFVHDSDGWRPKGHARAPMYRWMASWALAIRRPSDLGHPDGAYELPGLQITPHPLDVDSVPEGQLFATDLGGIGGRAAVRRSTLKARTDRAVQLTRDCGSQGIQQGLLRGEQGKVETVAGGAGAPQRAAQEEVRRRRGTPQDSHSPVDGIAQETPSAPSPSIPLRADDGPDRADDGPGMRDLPCESQHGPDGPDAYRPRSPDGHGPWCSLPVVQSGPGSPVRRPDPGDGDVRLPHACRDQWLIWCGLNDEQDAVVKSLGDECRSIDGRTPLEKRVEYDQQWRAGDFRILVVKPGMYSFGMNWQHCARMAFVGLSDSYEQYYQAIRRCYRFGQTRVVHAHIVLSRLESQIASNVARKETEAATITGALVAAMQHHRAQGETL